MFVGEYNHTMDAKGRIFMPAKMRDGLSEQFYIARGIDKCICIYPESEWQKISEKFSSYSQTDTRHARRSVFSSADCGTLDSQGRLMLASKYQQYAGLGKDVVVVGNNTCIEIWSTEGWAEEQKYFDNELVEKELIGLGF